MMPNESGQGLILGVTNRWQFEKDSGGIPASVKVKIEEAVDVRLLP